MNNEENLLARIEMLEYHQYLLLRMVDKTQAEFYKLVIENSLTKHDVEEIMMLCEKLSMKLEEQKAEGFIHFHPLFEEFKLKLHPTLHAEAVVKACLNQHLFQPLMMELKKYL